MNFVLLNSFYKVHFVEFVILFPFRAEYSPMDHLPSRHYLLFRSQVTFEKKNHKKWILRRLGYHLFTFYHKSLSLFRIPLDEEKEKLFFLSTIKGASNEG